MEDGVGKTLRDARNRRKLDLEQAEGSTKIRVRFLRALENEEWDVLPGETYVRSFIRTYANFLGLDGARLAEEHRRDVGAVRPGERLPRADPMPIPRAARPRRQLRLPPRVAAVAVSAVLVGILIVVGVTSGGGGSSETPPQHHRGGSQQVARGQTPKATKPKPKRGMSLKLTATAEVWVCLLDSGGEPLVDGQILETGSEAGPYRSGSFTVSFGNGEVAMTVNGQQASIPTTSSPVGYSIGAGGELRELSEGERPTCT